MLPVNKLFLLLITCSVFSFACTSSKRTALPAPAIGDANQSGDSSKEIRELQDKLDTALGEITELQGKVGQGDVSQTGDDDTAQTDSTAPVIHVSLVELDDKEEDTFTLIKDGGEEENQERSLLIGTYVTFHSDKDVTIETIKYGFNFTPDYQTEDVEQPKQTEKGVSKMHLYVYVKFIYDDTEYCVTAEVTDLSDQFPKGSEKEGAKVKMNNHEMNNKECGA